MTIFEMFIGMMCLGVIVARIAEWIMAAVAGDPPDGGPMTPA